MDGEVRPLINTKTLGATFASSLAAAAAAGIAAQTAAASTQFGLPYCDNQYTVSGGCFHGWQSDNHGNWGSDNQWFCLGTGNPNGWSSYCQHMGTYWMGSNWGGARRYGSIWNADVKDNEFLKAYFPYYTCVGCV